MSGSSPAAEHRVAETTLAAMLVQKECNGEDTQVSSSTHFDRT